MPCQPPNKPACNPVRQALPVARQVDTGPKHRNQPAHSGPAHGLDNIADGHYVGLFILRPIVAGSEGAYNRIRTPHNFKHPLRVTGITHDDFQARVAQPEPVGISDQSNHVVPLSQCLFNDRPADASGGPKNRNAHFGSQDPGLKPAKVRVAA